MTERLYLDRPDDASFEATVLATKDGRVLLDATLFYPTSGGQPHDTGYLDDARVTEVVEEGEEVWHVLEREARPFAAGTRVRGKIDPARRRDHREQHSGQHLLSAILLERARIPTLAFHLGAESSTIDVKAEKLGRDLLDRIETECGEVIRRDVPVRATVFRGEDADREAKALRRPPEAEALRSPRGLRVVEIAGIDRDACCGTHVARTGELGLVKVLSAERGKKGETRLTFVVGGRALRAFQERQAALDELSQELTTGFKELPARIEKIRDAEKAARTEARQLREEVLSARAAELARSARPRPSGGAFLAHRLAGGDAGDARFLATKLVALRPELVCAVAHAGEKLSLVLARGDGAPDLDLAKALGTVLAPLGGKGGGQPRFAQGAAPDAGRADEALALAEKMLAV